MSDDNDQTTLTTGIPKPSQILNQANKNLQKIKILKIIQISTDLIILGLLITLLVLYNQQLETTGISSGSIKYFFLNNLVQLQLLLLLVNHVAGTFSFIYIIIVCQTFPNISIQELSTAIYTIQIIMSLLSFVSTHLKLITKNLMSVDTFVRTESKQTQQVLISSRIRNQTTNIIICNVITALGLATVFYFGITIKTEADLSHTANVNALVLYLSIPTIFFIILATSYLYSLTIARDSRFKNLSTGFIITYLCLFTFIGLICAAIIHGTFIMWEIFHQFAKQLPGENIPTFDPYSAYSIAYVLCAFLLCNGALFGIFLGSSLSKIIGNAFDIKNTVKNCSHLLKFAIIFKQFVIIHNKNLLSQFIFFIILMTGKFADLILLLNQSMVFWTNSSTMQNLIAYIVLIIYLILLSCHSKITTKHVLIGVFTFFFGLIGLPMSLSTQFMINTITNMLPCGMRGFMQFFTNNIIPYATIISFLQAVPMMFKNISIPVSIAKRAEYEEEKYQKDLQNYNDWKEFEKKIQKLENDEVEQEISDFGTPPTKESNPIDFKEAYQASKLANSPYGFIYTNKANQFFTDPVLAKKASKIAAMFVYVDQTLMISLSGTRSVINLAPMSILIGIFDWCKVMFSSIIPFKLDDERVTWTTNCCIRKTKKILSLVTAEKQFRQVKNVLITGHHQGGATGIMLAYIMKQNDPQLKMKLYGFGVPHIVSQDTVDSLQKMDNTTVQLLQPGIDGKLYFSAIMTEQLSWSSQQCAVFPYAQFGLNISGYFAILSTGSSAPRCLDAMKVLSDLQTQKHDDPKEIIVETEEVQPKYTDIEQKEQTE